MKKTDIVIEIADVIHQLDILMKKKERFPSFMMYIKPDLVPIRNQLNKLRQRLSTEVIEKG